MTTEYNVFPIVEVVEEKRKEERRSDWHTPTDCYKLLDVQTTVDKIEKRLDDGSARMTRIEESIEDQRVRSDRIEHNIKGIRTNLNENTKLTQELVDILKAAKGFFRVLGWISTGVKWTAGLATGGIALYLALKGLNK